MFFGTKLIEYQASFDDLINLWCFYSITAPHYANHSNCSTLPWVEIAGARGNIRPWTQFNCDKWVNWAEIDAVILNPQQCILDNYWWHSCDSLNLTDFTWLNTHVNHAHSLHDQNNQNTRISFASVSPHLPLLTVNAIHTRNANTWDAAGWLWYN